MTFAQDPWNAPVVASDIKQLLGHRPRLESLAGEYLKAWHGKKLGPKHYEMPYPDYADAVIDFFSSAAESPCGRYRYELEELRPFIDDHRRITSASLEQVRGLLTWCVRGERFVDGHWNAVLSSGLVFALLDRFRILAAEMNSASPAK